MSAATTVKEPSPPECRAWAAWQLVPGIGWGHFKRLVTFARRHQTSLRQIWSRPRLWSRAGLTDRHQDALKTCQRRWSIDGFWHSLEQADIGVTCLGSLDYPPPLAQIDDPPWVLFHRGPWPVELSLPVAVVGTRHPTQYGRQATTRLVTELVGIGAEIVSGFMFGIDFLAHQTAINQQGRTVGVLGYGFDRVYPPAYRRLITEYVEQSAMTFISEYPPEVAARRGTFPQRNRIIAGLSLMTVVIEAGLKSGTHITARLAGEYGREVAAIPSPITSPYTAGTTRLINEGALLVTSAADILGEIGTRVKLDSLTSMFATATQSKAEGSAENSSPVPGRVNPVNQSVKTAAALASTEKTNTTNSEIIALLRQNPQTLDSLAVSTKQPVAHLNAELGQLELLGAIERRGDHWQMKEMTEMKR